MPAKHKDGGNIEKNLALMVATEKKGGIAWVNLLVIISHGHGAVFCGQFFEPITCKKFSDIAQGWEFLNGIENCSNP